MGGSRGTRGENRNAHGVLVGKREAKRSFRRSGRGWEDNIKIYIKGIGRKGVDFIVLARDRDSWRAFV
jgi:hypothetical protein